MIRRIGTVLAALSLVLAAAVLTAPSAAAHPYCGQVWGSQARSAGDLSVGPGRVVDVRAGRHACFDRLVLDVDSHLTAWSVRYVDRLVQDGSGRVVPVQGGARLEVVARVPALATTGWRAEKEIIDTDGFRTFRDVAFVSSFEGVTIIGLGVRARLPVRVFVLPGPGAGSRLVVDVGHRWCAPGHTRC